MDTPLPCRSFALSPRNPNSECSTSLEGYHILRRLGSGGMGSVYLAFDPASRRQVALKLLAEHLATDRLHVERFNREARIGSTFQHDNIVRTLDYGRDIKSGRYFMALEYVDGPSCQYLLDRDGQMRVDDAVLVAHHIGKALEWLHTANVVHRDVKPDNILLTSDGVAKLADFGIAKQLGGGNDLTALDAGFGSSWYMPFEQAKNAGFVDGRSDLFSLGATLYHLLTGVVPFAGDNHAEVMAKKQAGRFVPASQMNPDVPARLDAILARMLAFDPRRRYARATEFLEDIERSQLLNTAAIAVGARGSVAVMTRGEGSPTNMDLHHEGGAIPAEVSWHLRYRERNGRLFSRHATTRQVLEGIAAGDWPAGIEAARSERRKFRPLCDYPEFSPTLAETMPPEASTTETVNWNSRLLLIAGFAVGLLVAASLVSFLRGLLDADVAHTPLATIFGSIFGDGRPPR